MTKIDAALFVDGNEIIRLMTKATKRYFDYKYYVEFLETKFNFTDKYIYVTAPHSQPVKLLGALNDLGFKVTYKQNRGTKQGNNTVFYPQFQPLLTVDAMTTDSNNFVFGLSSQCYAPLYDQLMHEGKSIYLTSLPDVYPINFKDKYNLVDLTPVVEAVNKNEAELVNKQQ